MLRSAFVLAVLVVSLSAQALAASLPDPPFLNGGFVPPDAIVLAKQQSIQKLIDKYVAGNDTCDRRALVGLSKAYPTGVPETIQKVRDKWANCTAKLSVKIYQDAVESIVETGTPACLDVAGIQNALIGAEGVRRYVRGFSFCDGDAASPDPTTEFNVADSRTEVAAELKLHKVTIRSGVRVGRCYAKAIAATFQNGGTLSMRDLEHLSACETKAIDKGVAAVDKLAAALALPPCFSVTDLKLLITGAPSTATGIAALLYCAE